MAKTIKGITIEIDAETKGLGAALKDINKKTGDLTGELKKVENGLKFNPDNVVLVSQKQELLTQTVKETTKKLDALKQAEKEVQASFESGEIGEKQYRDFQREIVTTESKLGKYKNELEQVEKSTKKVATVSNEAAAETKDFGETLAKVSEKAGGVGGALSVGVTVPVLAAGAAMVSMASDYEDAMIKLKANTGATDKEMEEFSAIAKEIYNSGLGESMDGVASAVSNVTGQLSGLQPDEIITATKKAMMLEDVLGMDMVESLRGINSLMTTYGMTADEAFDYMVKGAQGGLNKTDELGDNLSEYAKLFEENGYSADEMFEILQAGLDGGAYSLDTVNDLVKEFGIRIGDGTIKTAIDEMGGSWKEIYDVWEASGESNDVLFQKMAANLAAIEDPQERQNALSQIWGSLGEDAGSKVVAAMGAVGDSYGEVTGAAQEVVDAQEAAFGTKMQASWRDFKEAFLPVGEALIDMFDELSPVISDFADDLSGIITNFNEMPEASQKFTLGMGAMLIALGPISALVSTISGAVGKIVEFVKWIAPFLGVIAPMFATFFAGLAGIFLAFGLSWEEDFITPLKEGMADFKINWDTFWAETQATLDRHKPLFESAWSDFVAALSTAWSGFWNFFADPVEAGWATFEERWPVHKAYFATAWDDFIAAIKNAWNELWGNITAPFIWAWEQITTTLERHKGYFVEAWEIITGAVETAKTKIGGFIDSIQAFFDNLDFSLPEIKIPSLPTFTISGEWDLSLADGDGLNAPKVDVSWNAEGGIFTKPTIFSTANGLQGVGEKGAEAIMPIDKLPELLGLDKQQIDYGLLASSIVNAITRSDIRVEMDRRPLGRLIGELA